MPRVIPEISADGQRLAQRLAHSQPGDIIPYQELSLIIHRNVQREGRSAMDCARKYALRDEQALFECIRGVGLKRLTDEEIVKVGPSHIKRIHSASRRGILKLSSIRDFTKLNERDQIRHNTAMSLLGVFFEVSRVKSIRRIEAAVAVVQKKLPLEDTLRAFGVQQLSA